MTTEEPPVPRPDGSARLSRRRLLQVSLAGAVAAGGGVAGARFLQTRSAAGPDGDAVGATEAGRRRTGRVVKAELRAAPAAVDLGGQRVRTWTYNGTLPGPVIRVTAGDELRVALANDLPEPTTIHWHGLALRNDMDGVPGLTMDAVATGRRFDYAFVVPDPGTYWFHPHVGIQLDTGMYAALIVDDPREPGDYDEEAVVIIDDWTDGLGDSPADILDRMRRDGMDMDGMDMDGMDMDGMDMDGMDMGGMDMGGMDMGGMDMGGMATAEQPLGSDTGDVSYPAHLVNGRLPEAPATVSAKPGQRVRLRVVNAGSDTAYRFAVGGHRLTVTHSDGFPVRPVVVDTLVLGMGERYDVVVTAADGAFPIVAVPEGKDDPAAVAVLRTSSGSSPKATARPAELRRRLLSYADLRPDASVSLADQEPDEELDLRLEMADRGRRWLINGTVFGEHEPLPLTAGDRVRLNLRNHSMMFHPMHLHGHTFALAGRAGRGTRKDTVNVLPMESLSVDVQANNPGQWAAHCHNAYHAELGMATVLAYRS